jgi:hypothetical protein
MSYMFGGWFNSLIFAFVIWALLAITMLVLGALTAYFGSGKSRMVGALLVVGGLVLGLVEIYVGHFLMPSIHLLQNVVLGTVFYVVAAVIGVAIGLLIFLGAIMKT